MNTSREKSANNWNHQFLWFFIVFFQTLQLFVQRNMENAPPPSKNPKLHSQGHKWTQITNTVGHTGPRPKPIILDINSNKHSSSQKKHFSQFGTHFAVQTRLDKPQQSFQSVSNSKTCHVIFFAGDGCMHFNVDKFQPNAMKLNFFHTKTPTSNWCKWTQTEVVCPPDSKAFIRKLS